MFQSGKNPVLDEIVQVVEAASKAEQLRMLSLLKAEIVQSKKAAKRKLLKNQKNRRRKNFRGGELKEIQARKIKSDLKEAYLQVEKIRRGKMKKQTLGDFLNEL